MLESFETFGDRQRAGISRTKISRRFAAYFFRLLLTCLLLVPTACRQHDKLDLRTLAPRNALVYLETNDLAAALEALTENQAFQTIARDETDFSALKNIQTAVVVGDFGSSADDANANETILNFKPHFAAIAETKLWSWQTNALVENQIDKFVRKKIGADSQLEKSDKHDGNFYVWTAADDRKIFALTLGSLIYFGNDESLIERCVWAKNGAADNLSTDEFYARNYSPENLASGYISSAGVEKIAALAGIFAAADATESDNGRNFIARVLPEILQSSIERIIWTANKTEAGIADNFEIFLKPPIASQIEANFAARDNAEKSLIGFLPADFFSATRYRIKNPPAVWQFSVNFAGANADSLGQKLLDRFSNSLLEPYGISDAEKFLNQTASEIIVVRFEETGEQSVVVARAENIADLKKTLTAEIRFNAPPEKSGDDEIFFSADKNTAAAFSGNVLILGDAASVRKCLQARQNAGNKLKNQRFEKFAASNSLIATLGKDADSADRIARALTGKKDETTKLATFYLTETDFKETKIERRSVSDFGLIGTILKQLEN